MEKSTARNTHQGLEQSLQIGEENRPSTHHNGPVNQKTRELQVKQRLRCRIHHQVREGRSLRKITCLNKCRSLQLSKMTRMGLGKLSQETSMGWRTAAENLKALRLASDNPQLFRRIPQFPPGLNGLVWSGS